MAKDLYVYPVYIADEPHIIRRFDSVDDVTGVIVAFCPNADEAQKIVGMLQAGVEHTHVISLLDGTHAVLRDIQAKIGNAAIVPARKEPGPRENPWYVSHDPASGTGE